MRWTCRSIVDGVKSNSVSRKSWETEATTSRSCASFLRPRHWYQLNIAAAAVTANSTHGRARPAVIRRHGIRGRTSLGHLTRVRVGGGGPERYFLRLTAEVEPRTADESRLRALGRPSDAGAVHRAA